MNSYALVTVGSTLFDPLIQAVDSPAFVQKLKSMGLTGVHIQHGNGAYVVQQIKSEPGFEVVVYRSTNERAKEVGNASLVIGHAGAGTILDSLEQEKPIIVIANTKLMSNHQLDIAEVMVWKCQEYSCLIV